MRYLVPVNLGVYPVPKTTKPSRPPKLLQTAIGVLLRAQRDRNGHRRFFVSRVLRVSPSSITNWEERGKVPLRSQLPTLAGYLGVTLVELEKMRLKDRAKAGR